MKKSCSRTMTALALIFTACFTSCDENSTIDVEGPDIEFTFAYSDINPAASATRSNAPGEYKMVAQSDTIFGEDLENFLANSGQDYTSVVEAATITNAKLKLSSGSTFAGVDSIKIVYQIAGSDEEIILVKAGVTDINADSLRFDTLTVDKTQAFALIKSNIIAKLYAIYRLPEVNCFRPGVTYTFTAKSFLTVKASAVTDGMFGGI